MMVNNGSKSILTSDTKDELSIKAVGGAITKLKKLDVVSKKPYEHSLMPAGLLSGMKQQQVVVSIEYMAGLRKK